jgi:hypothetical protein
MAPPKSLSSGVCGVLLHVLVGCLVGSAAMNGYAVCPVCKRTMPVTSVHRIMWRHLDKTEEPPRCPMSGKPVPVDEIWEVAS